MYRRTQNEAREGGRERKTCEDLKTCLAKPKVIDLELLTLNVFIQGESKKSDECDMYNRNVIPCGV